MMSYCTINPNNEKAALDSRFITIDGYMGFVMNNLTIYIKQMNTTTLAFYNVNNNELGIPHGCTQVPMGTLYITLPSNNYKLITHEMYLNLPTMFANGCVIRFDEPLIHEFLHIVPLDYEYFVSKQPDIYDVMNYDPIFSSYSGWILKANRKNKNSIKIRLYKAASPNYKLGVHTITNDYYNPNSAMGDETGIQNVDGFGKAMLDPDVASIYIPCGVDFILYVQETFKAHESQPGSIFTQVKYNIDFSKVTGKTYGFILEKKLKEDTRQAYIQYKKSQTLLLTNNC